MHVLCSCWRHEGTAKQARQPAQALRRLAEVQERVPGAGALPVKLSHERRRTTQDSSSGVMHITASAELALLGICMRTDFTKQQSLM